jgi:hypothetical protein
VHPDMERELARERMDELRRAGQAARGPRAVRGTQRVRLDDEVVLRGMRHGDGQAVRALAVLDSALPPVGPALVAEVRGSIRAVLPLDGGRPFSDPFHPSADLVGLLEERARQVELARTAGVPHGRVWGLWHGLRALRRLV